MKQPRYLLKSENQARAEMNSLIKGSFVQHRQATQIGLGVRAWLKQYAVILCPALLFFVIVLAMNWELFVTPLVGDGDLAVNAIQVQDAKQFHVLLGNYSRWHFHHPGPFLFYMFAAGEGLFYDLLHIVPAPLNAEYLTEIAFSTVCLFLAIYIFYVNEPRPLLPALCVLAIVLFLYAVDSAQPSAAVVSIWPPYAGLFCFLLFASTCASVAAGNWNHLPLLAASGMIMIHIHVAQTLFVPVMAFSSMGAALLEDFRRGARSKLMTPYKRSLWVACGITALFIAPIFIDWLIHHPSNISDIRHYLREHRGEHEPTRSVLLYTACFFTYYVRPELALDNPAANLKDLLHAQSPTHLYWSVVLGLVVFVLITHVKRRDTVPRFIIFIFAESALVFLLFLYWASRIRGGMNMFNGFFFFSVQLLALLALCVLLTRTLRVAIAPHTQVALACACAAPLFLVSGITNAYPGNPEVVSIVSALKQRQVKKAVLITAMSEAIWPTAAGVARYMEGVGIEFCFDSEWQFMYGPTHVCSRSAGYHRVTLTTIPPRHCKLPCSVVYSRSGLWVTATPDPGFLTVPVLITVGDGLHDASGFNVLEGEHSWTKKEGVLRFFLARKSDSANYYTIALTGTMFPGRPVTVRVNDSLIGVITQAGPSTQTFRIDSSRLFWNAVNTVTLGVPKAGPLGKDERTLGYYFESLALGPA